ncbi:MAG: gliding motility-associated C-terminal domain-containing protein [Cytophagaceae bacterium]|nr:gliding motility-associated C-terminal domain-containing protein [Cytophagaceae bacterium]
MALLLFMPGSVVLAQSQNLCNTLPAGAVSGAFEIDGNITSGCTPLNLKVKDLSGAEEVHYMFDYRDETSIQLDWIGSKDAEGAIINISDSPKDYKIIQYGKKGGQEMYACKNVNILPKPKVTYTQCNNFVTIFIPKQNLASNQKINFKLNAQADISLSIPDLPYNSGPKTVTYPSTLSFYYLDNSGQKICEVNQTITNNAYLNPNRGNISSIEMVSSTEAKMEFSGAFDPYGYDINLTEKHSPNPSVLLDKKSPGIYSFILPDSSKSYCFSVSRTENCGGTERSSFLCTIPFEPISPSPSENTLNWDTPPIHLLNSSTPLPPVFGNITVKNSIISKENNTRLPDDVISNTLLTKTYSIDCKKDYCYQLVSISEGTFMNQNFKGISKSLERCISRKTMLTPAITDILLNVTEDQKIEIDFNDDSGWTLAKDWYYLIKINKSDSVKTDSISTSPFHFEPHSADPSSEELCFRIQYKDICGSKSIPSPNVCNLVLKTDKNEDLLWNKVQPFGNSTIASFDMLEYLDNQNAVGKQYALNKSESSFQTNLDLFETEAKFRLKAISSSGKESHSNIVSIPIEALFYIPDAISMDGNNINDLLEMKGRFGRVKYTTLEIYDRWGSIIHSGTGKDWKPEGNLPAGTYFYKIFFTLTDNTYQNKSGKLEVLK